MVPLGCTIDGVPAECERLGCRPALCDPGDPDPARRYVPEDKIEESDGLSDVEARLTRMTITV
jgi:hypothetical protein